MDVPAVHGFDAAPDLLHRLALGAFDTMLDFVLCEERDRGGVSRRDEVGLIRRPRLKSKGG